MHALELANQLGLSDSQGSGIQALMQAHKAAAQAIGAQLVEAERSIEQLFRSGSVPQASSATTWYAAIWADAQHIHKH